MIFLMAVQALMSFTVALITIFPSVVLATIYSTAGLIFSPIFSVGGGVDTIQDLA